MRRLHLLALIALTAVGLLASASSAQAAPGDPFLYKASFGISGIQGGLETPYSIVVNHATGNLLILERGKGRVHQVDPEGHPVDFSALGSPTISIGASELSLVIDNTGGPTQGNIYVFQDSAGAFGGEYLWSYAPDGSPLGGSTPNYFGNNMTVRTIGVLPDGTLQIIGGDLGPFIAVTYNADQLGQPLGPREPYFPPNGDSSAFGGAGGAFDELGNAYLPVEGELGRSDVDANYAYSGKTGLPSGERPAVFDPSSNDVYTVNGNKILGVHYSDPLVSSTPFVALDGIRLQGGPIAFDATGQTLYVIEGDHFSVFRREPPSAPLLIGAVAVDGIRSNRAQLHAQLAAAGAPSSYHFEYGTDTSYGSSTPEAQAPFGLYPVPVDGNVQGLLVNTTYHVRLVATNSFGPSYGPDRVFKTYSLPSGDSADPCPNVLARKQTSAQGLADCRAYELVSAGYTGGYDVESSLVPGQDPFPGFPAAKDKVLYATHAGTVPGPWNATNKGPAPYLATRTAGGWVTDYKGLAADIYPTVDIFSSVLGEADSQLSTFAFVGQDLCDPCFTSGGLETGIPVRLPSGQLVQGMSGSLSGSVPDTAKPEGKVAKYFSADGQHLIFASKYAFEPGANTGGDLTVYDRNLSTGKTQIVSTDGSGAPLTGTVSELDVSGNGSRIVSAKQISLDGQGNAYTHPYMHIGSAPSSVDLAPGTSTGVLFAGMTADGSKVFFTTVDKLDGADTDASADLYEAAVDGSGNLDLSVLTESDSDACNPVANTNGAHWNTTGGSANCDAVAISGGGGVASASGAVYFLSPESFGGEGTLNQPNLYLADPGGSPSFVATLEPGNPLVLDSVKANAVRRTGDFQTTPNGGYSAFASSLVLTGEHTFGYRAVYRFDAAAVELDCVSCDRTGTSDDSLAGDATLAGEGLSLLDDGRVFFTTRFPLVINDANGTEDVYEWEQGVQTLISAGYGPFDSALLTASDDGTDVFFFTHDALAPEEDGNGQRTKIYDAREGGGFFYLPQEVACKAADECHGPSTPAPGPADIKSSGRTTNGNVVVCPKNRVKKRGQCVRKQAKKKKHAKRKGAKKRNASKTGKRGGRNA